MALGTIFTLTPILGWSWPALTPILIAAAGSLGYGLITTRVVGRKGLTQLDQRVLNQRMVEVPLEEHLQDLISEELGREETLNFQKDDLIVTFGHDVRGRFFIRVTGPKDRTAIDLRLAADEFVRSLIQQFAYNRVATQLDLRGVHVVEESVDEEGNIILRARRW